MGNIQTRREAYEGLVFLIISQVLPRKMLGRW
jgi:hypothetical protein